MFIKGMDLSFVDEVEAAGGSFYDREIRRDPIELMAESGMNAVRLRIWNDPPGGFCNLERTLAMARRIKERGLHFLLDFHYSDRWADPSNQWKPQAWDGLDAAELKDEVHRYTADVLASLAAQGTAPDMVQIGNEVTPGMLWPDGRVDGEHDTDKQWRSFAGLLQAGAAAVRSVLPEARVMLHIDRGGDWETTRNFFGRMEELGVDYDVIGQSFYTWWHGTLDDLRRNLALMAKTFGKPIIVVETAYPWTLAKPGAVGDKPGLKPDAEGGPGLKSESDAADEPGFILEREEQLEPGYPASVAGQSAYLRDLLDVVRGTPGGLGAGFYWWEPAWLPVKPMWSVGHHNNWANLTLFDYEGRRLATWDVLCEETD